MSDTHDSAVHALQKIATAYWVPDLKVVGKLPRVTCKACSDKNCTEHRASRCAECGAWISPAHIHLDYVGHADVNRTLTEIDVDWNWEPIAWDLESGEPKYNVRGNVIEMWGKLTLLGKSVICVGSVATKQPDAGKELVGDLIRNGAMRHNVYGSLWSKADRAPREFDNDTTQTPRSQTRTRTPPIDTPRVAEPTGTPSSVQDRKDIRALIADCPETQRLDIKSWLVEQGLNVMNTAITQEELHTIRDYIIAMPDYGG